MLVVQHKVMKWHWSRLSQCSSSTNIREYYLGSSFSPIKVLVIGILPFRTDLEETWNKNARRSLAVVNPCPVSVLAKVQTPDLTSRDTGTVGPPDPRMAAVALFDHDGGPFESDDARASTRFSFESRCGVRGAASRKDRGYLSSNESTRIEAVLNISGTIAFAAYLASCMQL